MAADVNRPWLLQGQENPGCVKLKNAIGGSSANIHLWLFTSIQTQRVNSKDTFSFVYLYVCGMYTFWFANHA